MPQLNGVQTVSDSVIIYGGNTYKKTEKDAESGDIVQSKCVDLSHYPFGAFYSVDGDEYALIEDDDGDTYYHVSGDRDFTVFRRVEAATTPLTTAQLIEQKRAELAELERMQAEEVAAQRPKVGDYASVTDTDDRNFDNGSVVRIIEDDGSGRPYKAVPALMSDETQTYEWFCADQLERITPTEARAALIAQVEALFPAEVVA